MRYTAGRSLWLMNDTAGVNDKLSGQNCYMVKLLNCCGEAGEGSICVGIANCQLQTANLIVSQLLIPPALHPSPSNTAAYPKSFLPANIAGANRCGFLNGYCRRR